MSAIPGKPGVQENLRNAKQAIATGWIYEWKSTEEAFAPEVELWTAFVSEKNTNFVHLPLFAKGRSVFIEMVALWTR